MDRLSVLHAGRLVASGTPAQVLTPDLLAEVYRVDADVRPDPRTGLTQVTVLPEGSTAKGR